MLRLNKRTLNRHIKKNVYSNTTNVKVKLYLNGSKSGGLKHSNTTNVKVKQLWPFGFVSVGNDSNTTNVKVKRSGCNPEKGIYM